MTIWRRDDLRHLAFGIEEAWLLWRGEPSDGWPISGIGKRKMTHKTTPE